MSKIQVNEIVNHFDNGAPDCPKGFTVSSGISTFTGAIDANGSLDVDGHTNLDNVNISGVVTAASLDVTGNVSIGGTLTYEDVTSIDAVGIITAKAGIHVTGGNVGIGTDNPATPLEVQASNLPVTIRRNSDAGDFIYFRNNNFYNVIGGDNGSLYFKTNGTAGGDERLRITGIGSLGVGTQTPKTDLDISQKTGAVALPQGTTAQRPSGSAPYIRKNTTNNALEYFDGTSWVEIITDYFPTGSTILG